LAFSDIGLSMLEGYLETHRDLESPE